MTDTSANTEQDIDQAPERDYEAEQAQHDLDTAQMLASIGRWAIRATVIALPFVAIAATVLILFTLFNSIQHLGTSRLAVNPSAADVTALAVTGTLALLLVAGAVLSRLQKRRTLVIAGLCVGLWLALTFLMAIIDTWMTVAAITPDKTLMQLGVFIYSALPALPLIPLAWLWLSATHERDSQYPTMAAAMGAMGLTIAKVFLTLAMFSMEAFYGMSIGVNPIAAVFAATLNAIAFSLALGSGEAAAHDQDHGGIKVWGVVGVFYAVIMFTIAAEAIVTFSGGRDGALKAMAAPLWLEQFAEWCFVSSIGLSALLIAVTFWRKSHRHAVTTGKPASDQMLGNGEGARVVRAPLGKRLAGGIRGARAGLDDVREALNEGRPKALPSPAMALGKDGSDDSDARERAAYRASIATMDRDELKAAVNRYVVDPTRYPGESEKEWLAIVARVRQVDPAGDDVLLNIVRHQARLEQGGDNPKP